MGLLNKMFSLDSLSARDKMILSIAGALLLLFVSFFLVIKPKLDERNTLREEIEKEQQALEVDKNHLEKVRELERKFEITEAKFVEAKKAVPNKIEIPSLIVQLSNIYMNENAEIESITPDVLTGEGDISSLSIAITSNQKASVYPLLSLIRKIESSKRYLKVAKVDLSVMDEEDEEDIMRSTLTIKAYSTEKAPNPEKG